MILTLSISPFQTATFSLLVSAASGYIFYRLLRTKLLGWENDGISPLPIANPKTLASWISFFFAITIPSINQELKRHLKSMFMLEFRQGN